MRKARRLMEGNLETEPQGPTLEDVIIELVMNGADRGAVVRPGPPEKKGLIALMLSPEASGTLGVALNEICNKLGIPDESPHRPLTIRTKLARMFEDADSAPTKWMGFAFHYYKTPVIGLSFSGAVCDLTGAVCTSHRAPVSWGPDDPAPGYEITETRER